MGYAVEPGDAVMFHFVAEGRAFVRHPDSDPRTPTGEGCQKRLVPVTDDVAGIDRMQKLADLLSG